jgi:peroxiredoxin
MIAALALAGALQVGSPAPTFTVTSLDGRAVSLLEALRTHEAVAIVFTSTVCPYANLFAPHLRDLDARYGPRGLLILAVNSNQFETADEMRDQAAEHGHAFPLVHDVGAVLADRLGAGWTPEAFLIDRLGVLRYHGRVKSKQGAPELDDAIAALLDGRPVGRAETKPFGCTIDRGKRSPATP